MIFLIPILVTLLAVWKPRHGLVAVILLWSSYLLRGTLFGIPTTVLELSLYGIVVIVSVLLVTKKMSWHWVHATRWAWILFGAWSVAWIISTFTSTDREASLGAFKAWFADPLLFAALLAIVIRTQHDRLVAIQSAVLSGSVVAVAGTIQMIAVRSTLQDGRLSSFFHPVANYAAMYIGPLLILGLAGVLYKILSRRWWWAVGIMAVAQLLTLSYGGFISVAVGGIWCWWFLPPSVWKRRVLYAAATVATVFVIGLSTTENFRQHFNPDRSSGAVRTQIWVTSWALIQQHPLLGIGPNTFQRFYRKEVPKHYYPPLEWLVAQPHNLGLALWLETGLLGLLSFLGLLIYHAKVVVKTFLRRPEHRNVVIASLGALLVIIVHGFVDTPFFKNDLAMEFLFITLLPWLGQQQIKK